MSFKIRRYKTFFFFFLFLHAASFLCGQEAVSGRVKRIAAAAFGRNSKEEIVPFMENEIKKLSSPSEKAEALKILADYEERSELFAAAAGHYLQAADLSPSSSMQKKLLTNAFASFLLADLIDEALDFCSARLLPLVKSPLAAEDIKILVYYEWLKIKAQGLDNEAELAVSVSTLKRYITDPAFGNFHPALLLTLWWLENDKKAEKTLLKKFPGSIEAGVVRGEVTLSPQTFWYLLPRSAAAFNGGTETVERPVSEGVESGEGGKPFKQVKESSAEFFQAGFFKTEDYANAMTAELAKKGFSAFVKKEKRAAGLFYSVLVKADGKGDVVLRLKNEGYEAVPIFD